MSDITADFTASPTSGPAPLTVQFMDQSIGDITDYYWDFGDGTASTSTNPIYTYQNPGTYTVTLTVTGPEGSDTKTIHDYITVFGNTGNMLLNGDFSDGTSHWDFVVISPAEANCSVQNGEYVISITHGGISAWDVHVQQSHLMIENGSSYHVSFDAYAESARQIIPFVAMISEPWTIYGGNRAVTLGTAKQTYTYTFTMNHPTNFDARLVFDVGVSDIDLYLDNIVLKKGGTPVENKMDGTLSPKSFDLLQNYPNPFNPATTICLHVPKSSHVKIEIFNVFGQHIETLIEEERSSGVYSILWNAEDMPSGIYLCSMKAGSFAQLKKLTLQK